MWAVESQYNRELLRQTRKIKCCFLFGLLKSLICSACVDMLLKGPNLTRQTPVVWMSEWVSQWLIDWKRFLHTEKKKARVRREVKSPEVRKGEIKDEARRENSSANRRRARWRWKGKEGSSEEREAEYLLLSTLVCVWWVWTVAMVLVGGMRPYPIHAVMSW